MKFILKPLSLLSLLLFFGLFSVQTAFADTFTLSGSVKDSSGDAISGATVSVNDANSTSTTTDSSGDYSLLVPSGVYDVQVTPPAGSEFSSAVALSQNISANKTLNFILSPAGTVVLKGKVYGPQGNALPNQTVSLINSSGNPVVTSTTDSSGNYSLQTSSGTYSKLDINMTAGSGNAPSSNAPQYYDIYVSNYSLTQSTVLDITIPAKKATVHVKDSANNSINNVQLDAITPNESNSGGLSIGGNITNASGYSIYSGSSVTTNSSGNGDLWLLPTNSNRKYTLTANPPSGTNFQSTPLPNFTITADTSVDITLQQSVTLQGVVKGPQGNVLPGQTVSLINSSGNPVASTTTDTSGYYSLTVSPGTYSKLDINMTAGSGNASSLNVPQYYDVYVSNYSVTQDKTQNITIPASQVTVNVKDVATDPISNVQVDANQPNLSNSEGLTLDSTITNASGYSIYSGSSLRTNSSGVVTLWLLPTNLNNKYSLIANPPSGSEYQSTTLPNVTFTGDSSFNITLKKPVTLDGHVYGPQGNALPNQNVSLLASNGSTVATANTNSSGYYTMSASTDTYNKLDVTATNNSPTLNSPQFYDIYVSNYTLADDTTLDITIPAKKVTVHVQDAQNNPVEEIEMEAKNLTVANSNGLTLNGSITNATGQSGYFTPSVETDSQGNAELWLLPNNGSFTYNFTATPPSGSIYSTFALNNVSVTANQTEIISLQYNHATPTSSIDLETEYSDDTYSNPTTVTLSATAAAGYTVANTYYKVDGGSQQTYTTPFTVTGNGSHTVEYWVTDNSGVTEAHKTKNFTIAARYDLIGTVYVDTNGNGFQDSGETGYAGATLTLNTSQTETTDSNGDYAFDELPSGTYVETLTVPAGYTATTTNPVNVSLSANTTQNFGIAPESTLVTAINAGGSGAGDFVSDTDYSGGTQYSSSASVDTSGVTDPAPQSVYQTVRYGNFTYTIPNLTPNENYVVKLHFNELYWSSAGNRLFNVSANGSQVLTNYDIYQAAGGKNKAIVEEVPVTANSSGNVILQFITVTDNAMVNGIEVYTGAAPSPTVTPTPTAASQVHINAGGGAAAPFVTDADYSGGTTFASTASVDTSGVTDPAPQDVYKTVRYGNFIYTIPHLSPNSDYTIRLHFNELYWDSAGNRTFNVKINGSQVLSNYDIYQAAGGKNKAIVEDFEATSDETGEIDLQFISVINNAMINGIELITQ